MRCPNHQGEGREVHMLVVEFVLHPLYLILSGNQFVMFSSEQGICLTKQSVMKRPVGDINFGMDDKCKGRILDVYQPLEIYCTHVG